MQVIPVQAVASQEFGVTLNNQTCHISIYQTNTGLYLDLSVNNSVIVSGVLCRDRTLIVRDKYRGFLGDLFFVDMQGTLDPYYMDLGDRYVLTYALPTELPA